MFRVTSLHLVSHFTSQRVQRGMAVKALDVVCGVETLSPKELLELSCLVVLLTLEGTLIHQSLVHVFRKSQCAHKNMVWAICKRTGIIPV